jgi:hypothetical protein
VLKGAAHLNFGYLGTGIIVGAILMAAAGAQYRVYLQTHLDKLKAENETLKNAVKALSTPRAVTLPERIPRSIPRSHPRAASEVLCAKPVLH